MRDAGHRTPDAGHRTSDGKKSKNNISTPQGGGHNSIWWLNLAFEFSSCSTRDLKYPQKALSCIEIWSQLMVYVFYYEKCHFTYQN